MLLAEPEQAPPDKAQPSGSDAAEMSQQLHALASLLSIDGHFQQAGQLIGAINEAVRARMGALPQSFHEPILPEGSLSSGQVCPGSQLCLCSPSDVMCQAIIPTFSNTRKRSLQANARVAWTSARQSTG